MFVKTIPLNAIEFTEPEFADQSRRLRYTDEVAGLAANILLVGLINPVLVRQTGKDHYTLIAGRKRMLAYRSLREERKGDARWAAIPAHIYTRKDVMDVLAAVSENSHRGGPPVSVEIAQAIQTLPPSEQLAFLSDIKSQMEEDAKRRQKGGVRAPEGEKGKTAAKLGKLLNKSAAWVERSTAIIKAAEEDPEHFGKFKEQMDSRGRCFCAYQRMLDMKRALELKTEPVIRHAHENSFVCGDALEILRGMPDNSWDNIVSDPPFGLGKVYDGWKEPGTPQEYWAWLEPVVKEMFRVVRPGGLIALFQSYLYRRHYEMWFGPYGYTDLNELFVCKSSVDYRKNNRNKRRKTATGEHDCPLILAIDPVVMLWKKGDRPLLPLEWKGRKRENWLPTAMDIDPVGKLFPFAKPVSLMAEVVFRWCREGSSVLDPICGSGATCIAAERLGHRWMGIDRSEGTCKLAAKRLAWHRRNGVLLDNNNWSTEQEFWEELHKIFHFTVDAAADKDNAKLPRFWTKTEDALRQDWSQEVVWLNPPFDSLEPFLEKAKSARACCSIVPATCLNTRYFKKVRPDYIALLDRRVHFSPPTGPRRKVKHAPWGYPLLIYGAMTEAQIVALESLHLAVYGNVPKSLRRG